MFISKFEDSEEFLAGDHTRLRELLSPVTAPLSVRYSLAHASLAPGFTSLLHRIRSSEVYYIMEGTGLMNIDDEKTVVHPTDTVYIPPGATQCITNIGDDLLVFLCIVDPAWEEKDEEIL
ncbi:MAG: cupin domain-containing protein [Candidatus Geothermincolia bacterium]